MSVPQDSRLDDVAQFVLSGKAGDYIFQEGDIGADMYIIQEGEIEILKVSSARESRLALLESGDFFGEMSLLEELPRDASARAVTDYRLLKIDHSTFDQMVHENPEIAVRMLRMLSHRLRQSQGGADRTVAPPIPTPSTGTEAAPVIAARATLVHESTGNEFELSPEVETSIGRKDRVTGFVPVIDFTAVDTQRTLSRRHAKILRCDDGFYLQEEIGTTNGTFLNDEKIKTGVPVRLHDGDEVRLGFVTTRFHQE